MNIQVENLKDKLKKLSDPILVGLLSGKEVEVKPGVFIKLNSGLDFKIIQRNNALEVQFKAKPQVRVVKLLQFYGEITGLTITQQGITVRIDGLPDLYLEAIS